MRTVTRAELPQVPSLLIRISREWHAGLTEEQLYERVRRYWKIQPERREAPPVLAFGLADGVIRAVYRIDSWERFDMAHERKSADRVDQSPHQPGVRVGFVGRPAVEFQNFVGCVLADAPRGQNPVTYTP